MSASPNITPHGQMLGTSSHRISRPAPTSIARTSTPPNSMTTASHGSPLRNQRLTSTRSSQSIPCIQPFQSPRGVANSTAPASGITSHGRPEEIVYETIIGKTYPSLGLSASVYQRGGLVTHSEWQVGGLADLVETLEWAHGDGQCTPRKDLHEIMQTSTMTPDGLYRLEICRSMLRSTLCVRLGSHLPTDSDSTY
jgi:hypothetical protein